MRFFFIYILLASFFLKIEAQSVNQSFILNNSSQISEKDKKEINLFFKNLFFEQSFAYSLFGDKPMSLSDEILDKFSQKKWVELLEIDGYCDNTLKPFCDPSNSLNERWKIWEKYKSKFTIKNYLLLKKEIGSQTRLFFINIKAFKKIVGENINLFRKIINSNLTADDLLEEIKNENKNMMDTLHDNEGLLGILLGFGTHNSMLFQKREDLINSLGKNLKDPRSIQKKINELDEKLQSLHSHDPYIIATMHRVGFAADQSHEETHYLKSKYDRLNKKVLDIFARKDWFEQVLLKLTAN